MPLSDYSHWNEEAELVWWEEEGRHADRGDGLNYEMDSRDADAADAYAEELAEKSSNDIITLLSDADYRRRWPKAVPLLLDELQDRLGTAMVWPNS